MKETNYSSATFWGNENLFIFIQYKPVGYAQGTCMMYN